MKYINLLILGTILITSSCYSQTDYLLKYGDFENKINKWILRGNCEFSNENVHKGNRALKIRHSTQKENIAYVYLEQPTSEFEFNIWINPADSSFQTKIDLIANWDKSGADFICRLVLNIDSVKIYSLHKNRNYRYQINIKQWNKISIVSDSLGYRKNVLINDLPCGSVISGDNLSTEALILGGLKCDDCFGTIFYDDASIVNTNVKTTFWGDDIYWIQTGLITSVAGLGINLQIAHISGIHIFSVRFLSANKIRLFDIGADSHRYDPLSESLQEIGLLYGMYYRNNYSIISLSAGISYVDATIKINDISINDLLSNEFKTNDIVKINLPIELSFKRIVTKNFGISAGAYAIINDKYSFFGATIGLQFGNLY